MSIYNAIGRFDDMVQFKSEITPSLEITPYEGYITGLTPFRAKEDITLILLILKIGLKTILVLGF